MTIAFFFESSPSRFRTVVNRWCIGAVLTGLFRTGVHHKQDLIWWSWGKHMVKWSTNENGKLLPLVGPVQVQEAVKVVRSWWMPCVPVVVDMIKKRRPGLFPLAPSPPPPFPMIIDKQMWAACEHRKLPARKIVWEMRNFVYLFDKSNQVSEFKNNVNMFHQNNMHFNLFLWIILWMVLLNILTGKLNRISSKWK